MMQSADLDRLETEAELRRLIYTYCRGVDRLDADLIRAPFHADAEVELGEIYRGGVSGFVDVALDFMGMMEATRHDVSNILVLVHDRDRAATESYVSTWHRIRTPEGERELVVLGRYLDHYERRAGVWRISWHSEIMDWGAERDIDSRWFENNRELIKGRRDRSDVSYASGDASG